MPPVPVHRWKRALISLEDIALHLRGHLEAGTLNIDFLNSQLHPRAELRMSILIDHQTMEDIQEKERAQPVLMSRPENGPNPSFMAQEINSKGKKPVKQPPMLELVTKRARTEPIRQSSRLHLNQDGKNNAEYLFDLDSAKDIALSPTASKTFQSTFKNGPPDAEAGFERENLLDDDKVALPRLSGESDRQPALAEANTAEAATTGDDGDVEDNTAGLRTIESSAPIHESVITSTTQIVGPSSQSTTCMITETTTIAISPSSPIQTSSGAPEPSSNVSSKPTNTIAPPEDEAATRGPAPISIAEISDSPASSTRSRMKRSLDTNEPAPLHKFAIVNGARRPQSKVVVESEKPSTVPVKRRRKSLPREPDERTIKREGWDQQTATSRTAAIERPKPGRSSAKQGKAVDDSGAAAGVDAIESTGKRTSKSGEQAVHKKPRLHLYFKKEPVG